MSERRYGSRGQYSEAEAEEIVKSYKEGRIQLICGIHNYLADVKHPPVTSGCANCWKTYYFVLFANTPKHLQQETLDQLEAAIHHSIELENKGKWDVELDRWPAIKIERDAEPD